MIKIEVPGPGDYTAADFKTSNQRVAAARETLLKSPKAKSAYDDLSERIAARVRSKQATLREVRRAVGLTQAQLAETLGVAQGDISRLEQQPNMHLSTLSRFIEATGGRLHISAVYGDTEVTLKVADLGHTPSVAQSMRTQPTRPPSALIAKAPAPTKKATGAAKKAVPAKRATGAAKKAVPAGRTRTGR